MRIKKKRVYFVLYCHRYGYTISSILSQACRTDWTKLYLFDCKQLLVGQINGCDEALPTYDSERNSFVTLLFDCRFDSSELSNDNNAIITTASMQHFIKTVLSSAKSTWISLFQFRTIVCFLKSGLVNSCC